jgi:hypothetical protein
MNKKGSLRCLFLKDNRGRLASRFDTKIRVLLVEFFNTTSSVNNFLLPGVKRMANGADLNRYVLSSG